MIFETNHVALLGWEQELSGTCLRNLFRNFFNSVIQMVQHLFTLL